MEEEKKHARLRFPKWDIETIIGAALGSKAYESMEQLETFQLEAQIALGIKALDQQPKQLDPVSFQAASLAANLMFSAGSNELRDTAEELKQMPEGAKREDTRFCHDEAHKLMMFAEQSMDYVKGIEVSFGPQIGQRR